MLAFEITIYHPHHKQEDFMRPHTQLVLTQILNQNHSLTNSLKCKSESDRVIDTRKL